MSDTDPRSLREELEIRVVALLTGEISEADADELEKILSVDEELADYRDRMAELIGDVHTAREEISPKHPVMRFSDERREALLDAIESTQSNEVTQEAERKGNWQRRILGLAALLTVSFIIFSMSIPAFQKVRSSAPREYAMSESLYEAPSNEVSEDLQMLGDVPTTGRLFRSESGEKGSVSELEATVEYFGLQTAIPEEVIEGTPQPVLLAQRRSMAKVSNRDLIPATEMSADYGVADSDVVGDEIKDEEHVAMIPVTRGTVARLSGFRDGGDSNTSGPVDPFAPSSSSSPSGSGEEQQLKEFFQSAGVNFESPGSDLAFDGEQLIVSNSPRELARMRKIVDHYDQQQPVEAKSLEVAQANVGDLDFDWDETSGTRANSSEIVINDFLSFEGHDSSERAGKVGSSYAIDQVELSWLMHAAPQTESPQQGLYANATPAAEVGEVEAESLIVAGSVVESSTSSWGLQSDGLRSESDFYKSSSVSTRPASPPIPTPALAPVSDVAIAAAKPTSASESVRFGRDADFDDALGLGSGVALAKRPVKVQQATGGFRGAGSTTASGPVDPFAAPSSGAAADESAPVDAFASKADSKDISRDYFAAPPKPAKKAKAADAWSYRSREELLTEVDQSWERPKVFDVSSKSQSSLSYKPTAIVIPQINFRGMPLSQVVKTLNSLSMEYDPEGVGIPIEYKPVGGHDPRVNISLRNLNVDQVLQFVTQQVNYSYDVTGDKIIIQAPANIEEQTVVAQRKQVRLTPKAEKQTSDAPTSTFSLNVSDVSFKMAQAALSNSRVPVQSAIRSEEFVNSFDYGDPAPRGDEPIAFNWEIAKHPYAHGRHIVRFSLETQAAGRSASQPLNINLLVDNSGSMQRPDRRAILEKSLESLGEKLTEQDQLNVILFARQPKLIANASTVASQQAAIHDTLAYRPEGGTNLEAALDAAYANAHANYNPEASNRLILMTDGAANLGDVDPTALAAKVIEQRKQGIALDAYGIGWEDYNDALLEEITRNGDGRYAFLNSVEDAFKDFSEKLAGSLRVAAADVKVQIIWNTERVTAYRQVGYDLHQLKKEDFRDNTVDAAEIGEAEAGTALYVLKINEDPDLVEPLGTLSVRYREPATGKYHERSWPLNMPRSIPALESASPALKLAASSAFFAERLAENPYARDYSFSDLSALTANLPAAFPTQPRVVELQNMINSARILLGDTK